MSFVTIQVTLTKGETVEKYMDKFIKNNNTNKDYDVYITKDINGEVKKYNYVVWQGKWYKCKRIKRR